MLVLELLLEPDDVVPLDVPVDPVEVVPELVVDVVLASDCAASPITAVAAMAVTASPDVTTTVLLRARSR